MADVRYTLSTPSPTGVVIPASTNPQTILQSVSPANQRQKLLAVMCGFVGTTVTNQPIIVQLVSQSTAGSGGSSVTPRVINGAAETIQSTGISGPTAEPTLTAVLQSWTVHPQLNMGQRLPLSREWINAGGGRLALRCIDPQGNGNTCHATMEMEE